MQEMNLAPRPRWPFLLSVAILWIACPVVLTLVVMRNFDLGVYGHHDAILIPIGEAVALFAIGLPYLAFFAISGSRRFSKPLSIWTYRPTIRWWVLLALFLIGILIIGSYIAYWADRSHILIVVVYSLVIGWMVWARPYASLKLDDPLLMPDEHVPSIPPSNPIQIKKHNKSR